MLTQEHDQYQKAQEAARSAEVTTPALDSSRMHGVHDNFEMSSKSVTPIGECWFTLYNSWSFK
jgi:hypothetical protein